MDKLLYPRTWKSSDILRFERTFLRETVAARIQNLMDGLDVSRAELAKRLGKSPAWVTKLLSGKQNVTLDTLAAVGGALGVRWDPKVVAAPTENTSAESDPELPGWVPRESGIRIHSWRTISQSTAPTSLTADLDETAAVHQIRSWLAEDPRSALGVHRQLDAYFPHRQDASEYPLHAMGEPQG